MTHPGYAPTHDMPQIRTAHPVTAPAYAVPGTMRPGTVTLVNYHGPTRPDLHGRYWLDGLCSCGCGRYTVWRQERDRVRRLSHVSPASVTTWRFPS